MAAAGDPMRTSTSARLNGLLAAVIDGDVSHLLENVTRTNVNYADPRYRLTLLQWAISLGRLPTTELLLACGASVLTIDGNGFSSLHRAVWCADVAVVRAVLFLSPTTRVAEAGRSVAPAGRPGVGERGGLRSEGQARGEPDYTTWLDAHLRPEAGPRGSDPPRPIRWRPGAERLVNLPHEATGRTPLMLAAVRGARSIVHFLLHVCRADMSMEDRDGFTAPELAALCGHTDIVSLFLEAAEGDGSGRAFPRIQQRAEDYVLTAKTVKQQQRLNEVNRQVCADLAPQSTLVFTE